MTRPPCSSDIEKDQELKKGPWTPDEDLKLMSYITRHGHGSWRSLPANAGLQRCGKSCRLRWTNYLRPDIKRGRFSQEEDRMIVHLHALLGNRWSAIASHLPRRTDNEIKNYWNTHLKKRLLQMGIDPVTHNASALSEDLDLDSCNILPALSRPVVSSTLSHMSQWECARAEAEARLSRQCSSTLSNGTDFVQASCIPLHNDPKDHASTSFMSSWKAQVTETLRPSFGVVELDKTNPVNLQTFLRDWESSLQIRPSTTSLGPFSACDSPIDFPDFASSGAASGVVSPQYTTASSYALPSSAQITERLLASRAFSSDNSSLFLPPPSKADIPSFNLPGDGPNQFIESPTSTLLGPDYDSACSYTNSPCVSSSNDCSFDLLAAQSLGLIHAENEQAQITGSLNMFPADDQSPPGFWSPPPSSDAFLILPHHHAQNHFPKPSSFMAPVNHGLGVPNNIPIPQFDFLC